MFKHTLAAPTAAAPTAAAPRAAAPRAVAPRAAAPTAAAPTAGAPTAAAPSGAPPKAAATPDLAAGKTPNHGDNHNASMVGNELGGEGEILAGGGDEHDASFENYLNKMMGANDEKIPNVGDFTSFLEFDEF